MKKVLIVIMVALSISSLILIGEIKHEKIFAENNQFPIIVLSILGYVLGDKIRDYSNTSTTRPIFKNKNDHIIALIILMLLTTIIFLIDFSFLKYSYLIITIVIDLLLFSGIISEKLSLASDIHAYAYIFTIPILFFLSNMFFAPYILTAYGILFGATIYFLFNYFRTLYQEYTERRNKISIWNKLHKL